MLIKKPNDIPSSEITSKSMYLNRRKFLAAMGIAGAAAAGAGGLLEVASSPNRAYAAEKISNLQKSPFSTTEKVTPEQTVTHYNNYYEFGPKKTIRPVWPRTSRPALDGHHRRPCEEEADLRHRQHPQDCAAGRTHLSAPLRRRVVDRGALDRLLA